MPLERPQDTRNVTNIAQPGACRLADSSTRRSQDSWQQGTEGHGHSPTPLSPPDF